MMEKRLRLRRRIRVASEDLGIQVRVAAWRLDAATTDMIKRASLF